MARTAFRVVSRCSKLNGRETLRPKRTRSGGGNMKRMISAASALAASLLLAGVASAAEAVGPGPEGRETLSQTYRESRMDDVAYQKSVGPMKIFDNLWYVGPGYVSVWLLTTPQGHILLDTAQEPYVDHVLGNIVKAGFNPADIK